MKVWLYTVQIIQKGRKLWFYQIMQLNQIISNWHLISPWESEQSRYESGLPLSSPLQLEVEEEEEDSNPILDLSRGCYAYHISPLYKDTNEKKNTLSKMLYTI